MFSIPKRSRDLRLNKQANKDGFNQELPPITGVVFALV